MLTIRTCKAFSRALGEYLRQADYYSQGMKVDGTCHGRLCAELGLAVPEAGSQAQRKQCSRLHAPQKILSRSCKAWRAR